MAILGRFAGRFPVIHGATYFTVRCARRLFAFLFLLTRSSSSLLSLCSPSLFHPRPLARLFAHSSPTTRSRLAHRSLGSQLLTNSPSTLTGLSADRPAAPVGINPKCGIPRLNHDGSISNVANIAVCGASVFFVVLLIWLCNRRKAAVGEFPPGLFSIYFSI